MDLIMPEYRFLNNDTQEEYLLELRISEYDDYVKTNNVTPLLNGVPAIGDPMRLGLMKPSDGFRDRLREIKKTHNARFTKSTINTF